MHFSLKVKAQDGTQTNYAGNEGTEGAAISSSSSAHINPRPSVTQLTNVLISLQMLYLNHAGISLVDGKHTFFLHISTECNFENYHNICKRFLVPQRTEFCIYCEGVFELLSFCYINIYLFISLCQV